MSTNLIISGRFERFFMQITLDNSKQIMDSYMPLIISMARKYPGIDYDEAIDETRMILLESIPSYNPEIGTFGNFLKNKLRYHYLNKSKLETPQSLDELDNTGTPIIDSIEDPFDFEDQIFAKEKYKELYQAINKLTEKDQQIIKLKFWEDMTNAEIGQILGISSKTVSNRLSLSLKKLKNLLGS